MPSFRMRAQTSRLAGVRVWRYLRRYSNVRPESMMSSTRSTWRPEISKSRSFRIRTTPEVRGGGAVAGDRHEVELQRQGDLPGEVAHQDERPLEHADEEQVPVAVVVGDAL